MPMVQLFIHGEFMDWALSPDTKCMALVRALAATSGPETSNERPYARVESETRIIITGLFGASI